LTWQKALILWFQGKVEILEYHDIFVNSVRFRFQLPAVLRLKTYTKTRKKTIVRFSRENVFLRDEYACQYCKNVFLAKYLTLDHVTPASKGGPRSWTNVVTACRPCNQKKGNKSPSTAGMPLFREPKVPHWLPSHELVANADRFPEIWIPYLQFHG
jgi:5-methylcytosine-specific restriction endonuclease McrA